MKTNTYMHFGWGQGRVTLALRIDKGPSFYEVQVAPAFCSKNDNFSKANGRTIAKERLVNGSKYNFVTGVPFSANIKEEVWEAFIIYVRTNILLPQWVRHPKFTCLACNGKGTDDNVVPF